MPVPPITKLVIPVIVEAIAGSIAIIPKNKAPTLVILYNIFSRYCFVAAPGLILE